MRVWHDGGDGITDISKKHFKRLYKRIRPIEVFVSKDGVFTFQLYGTHKRTNEPVVILESGFNCGYGGTGPHGTVWALELLGVPKSLRKLVFSREYLIVNFRSGYPRAK